MQKLSAIHGLDNPRSHFIQHRGVCCMSDGKAKWES
jgi:hypothetical protein